MASNDHRMDTFEIENGMILIELHFVNRNTAFANGKSHNVWYFIFKEAVFIFERCTT